MLSKMLIRAAGGPTLAYVTKATSTSSTITIPATANIGDIAILLDYGFNTTTTIPTNVVPTNWTSITTKSWANTYYGQRITVSYKKLVSGDPGTSITGINANYIDEKQMLVFRPSKAIATITIAGLISLNFSTNPDIQTVATQTPSYIVLGCATNFEQSVTWTSTWYNETFNIAKKTEMAYKIFNSSPASVGVDFTSSNYSSSSLHSFALVVT